MSSADDEPLWASARPPARRSDDSATPHYPGPMAAEAPARNTAARPPTVAPASETAPHTGDAPHNVMLLEAMPGLRAARAVFGTLVPRKTLCGGVPRRVVGMATLLAGVGTVSGDVVAMAKTHDASERLIVLSSVIFSCVNVWIGLCMVAAWTPDLHEVVASLAPLMPPGSEARARLNRHAWAWTTFACVMLVVATVVVFTQKGVFGDSESVWWRLDHDLHWATVVAGLCVLPPITGVIGQFALACTALTVHLDATTARLAAVLRGDSPLHAAFPHVALGGESVLRGTASTAQAEASTVSPRSLFVATVREPIDALDTGYNTFYSVTVPLWIVGTVLNLFLWVPLIATPSSSTLSSTIRVAMLWAPTEVLVLALFLLPAAQIAAHVDVLGEVTTRARSRVTVPAGTYSGVVVSAGGRGNSTSHGAAGSDPGPKSSGGVSRLVVEAGGLEASSSGQFVTPEFAQGLDAILVASRQYCGVRVFARTRVTPTLLQQLLSVIGSVLLLWVRG